MTKKSSSKPSWGILLFGLPFAGVGIGLLVFSILPNFIHWIEVKSWQPIPAQLSSADLDISYGDDSTTYMAKATYHYTVNGKAYSNNRVGIASGHDNIGSWQQRKAAELKKALQYETPSHPHTRFCIRLNRVLPIFIS